MFYIHTCFKNGSRGCDESEKLTSVASQSVQLVVVTLEETDFCCSP